MSKSNNHILYIYLGIILQKISFLEGEHELAWHLRWRWFLGLLLIAVIASIMDCWSLAFCPLSLVAPLNGATIVTNTLFSIFVLNEKLGLRPGLCLTVVVVGVVLSAANGSTAERKQNPQNKNLTRNP